LQSTGQNCILTTLPFKKTAPDAEKGGWQSYAETLVGRIVAQPHTRKLCCVARVDPGLTVDTVLTGDWRERCFFYRSLYIYIYIYKYDVAAHRICMSIPSLHMVLGLFALFSHVVAEGKSKEAISFQHFFFAPDTL
jgi:hypothetical protein